MNKIFSLLDKNYVKGLFDKELPKKYPDFESIQEIKITPIKKKIWDTTYHVVFLYNTTLKMHDSSRKTVQIYCTAHSNEPRKNAFEAMTFLWNEDFSSGDLTVPKPLFYSNLFHAFFYEGVSGKHLYYYIRENDQETIKSIVPRAAEWFTKLHAIKPKKDLNFNKTNSRIETVLPGKEKILERIKNEYPQYIEKYRHIYSFLVDSENEFIEKTDRLWLVHGDAHPENIILTEQGKLAVIDFADLSLADFARDLGAFLQQMEYMIMRKIGDREFSDKMAEVFLASYFDSAKIKMDEELKKRIDLYYCFTAIRTATYFLIKDIPEQERTEPLLASVMEKLKLYHKDI